MVYAFQQHEQLDGIIPHSEGTPLYVSTATAAVLMDVSERRVRELCQTSKMTAMLVSGSDIQGGRAYMVYVPSLPLEAQMRHIINAEQMSECDMAAYHARYGDEGIKELNRRYFAVLDYKREMLDAKHGSTVSAAETIASHNGITTRTLYRWISAYKDEGIAGLMQSLRKQGAGQSKTLCLMAQDYIRDELYRDSKLPQSAIFSKLIKLQSTLGNKACERCAHNPSSLARRELAFGQTADQYEICSSSDKKGIVLPINKCTINRYVASLPKGAIAYAQRGSRYWEANYMHKIQRKKPTEINACWFGDNHLCDIFVIGSDGTIMRPWIIAFSDAASGCFVGTRISENPNSTEIIKTLRDAIMPKQNSIIQGMVRTLYIDNGKDYRSKKMEGSLDPKAVIGHIDEQLGSQGALAALQISVIHAQPYKAWAKTIERLFGIVEDRWMRELPGWCGGKPSERPQDLSRAKLERMAANGELLTIEQFAQIWHEQIIPAYHYERYGNEQSPIEIYKSLPKARQDMPSYDMMALLQTEIVSRKVGYMGIRLHNRVYWDERLQDYIGKEVTVRYNKDDMDGITVISGNRHICTATLDTPFALVGEDKERVAAHIGRQRAAKKAVREEIQRTRKSVALLRYRDPLGEALDETYQGGITSTEYRRAAIENAEIKVRKRRQTMDDKKSADMVMAKMIRDYEQSKAASKRIQV